MSNTNTLLVKNGTIVTHDKTIFNMDILISNDKIVQIDLNIEEENCDVIDATGCIVVPGLVDLHCDLCDPGYDYKETLETAGNSAIAGGFTTLTYYPRTVPVIDNKAVVEYMNSKAKQECPVHVFPYGAYTKNCENKEMAEIGEMQIAGVVGLSDGDRSVQDSALMKNIFHYGSMFDIPLIVHCEETTLSNRSGLNEGYVSTQLGIIGNPECAETTMLSRNVLLAETYGARLHVTHVSTARSVQLIRNAKKAGGRISAETSPHYFSLDERYAYDFNTLVKVNPPLRTEEDLKGIIRGLKDGTIDAISSDHKPHTIDSKELEFDLASSGISSFETAFPVAYTYLVKAGHLTLEELVEKMAFNPAKILTLNKGRISKGADADLMIFDPEEIFTVDASKFKSKAKYSPYDGMKLQGLVRYTIVGGKKHAVNV
ncbi:dihydroorotase [Anaerotalea alkaliphila]|uniref:Dihydroorotase n=1 Tax=Anaerotalea alkaliphila TaxID=2662126 RepID=A0A7X5HWG2_9FIRM|nr:dihydroorotase [Anaerotalea alkaliphila]NDL67929.1 dihydroorotase [Anaerotalea alkaliphila]